MRLGCLIRPSMKRTGNCIPAEVRVQPTVQIFVQNETYVMRCYALNVEAAAGVRLNDIDKKTGQYAQAYERLGHVCTG